MAEPILTVEHLIKAYGETPVLDDISFAVKPGEVGCGWAMRPLPTAVKI